MSRSSKKGVYVDEKLLTRVKHAIEKKDHKPIKTWSRRSMVTGDFVGATLSVHNGRAFVNVFCTENMVGHKVGEFVPTRTFRKHGGSNDKLKAAKMNKT
jgi:small subunit ribosomal protein S19